MLWDARCLCAGYSFLRIRLGAIAQKITAVLLLCLSPSLARPLFSSPELGRFFATPLTCVCVTAQGYTGGKREAGRKTERLIASDRDREPRRMITKANVGHSPAENFVVMRLEMCGLSPY